MMIDAKLCLHFAEVCLRTAEQEADDHAYRIMLLELAKEWLNDAQRSSTRQRGKRGRARGRERKAFRTPLGNPRAPPG